MTDAPAITIPSELLPEDGRFGCGPSKIRPGQMDALAAAGEKLLGTSHRQKPVLELVRYVREGLAQLFRLPEGYEVLLGDGGATTLWDALTYSLMTNRSQHAVSGEFGGKFAAEALGAPFLGAPSIHEAEAGSLATCSYEGSVDVYAWAHNETSTGVVAPVIRPAGAMADQLTVVDGTSAAGGIDVEITQADVYYFSPQKNLGAEGGLWFALCSPAAIARIEKIASTDRWIPQILSLKVALDNSRKNQTLNTPAIATLILLARQLAWINKNGGLAWASARTKRSSDLLYSWASGRDFAQPFVSEPAQRSPVVATIDFDASVSAATVSAVLRANGVVDVDPYRKLGRNQLRIGTFVSVEAADVEALIACVDYVVERL